MNKIIDDKGITCLIIHKGYQPYLKYNLEITSKYNNVFLIGDNSVRFLENINKNVEFFDINQFQKNEKIELFRNNFVNYSTNSFEFEWFCFERVLLIESFIKKFKLENVFHIDSDNVMLTGINDFNFTSGSAYIIPTNQEQFGMAGSIHAGLIDLEFCSKFSQLYEDIYINKSKFNLIENKINYHKSNNIPGGICDMTLYFLLYEQNLIKPQNLLEPFHDKKSEEYIFMNNYNYSNGYFGNNNFEMKKGKIRIFRNNLVYDIVNNKKVKIANIHFQGAGKKYLNRYTKYKF
tara:strand:+ start:1698 stop:2570 length:873 start_codon:yes stop_codon:yes gene_type:complete